jgi:hypothetical protein
MSEPQGEVEIVAANDLVLTDDLAYLMCYDSVHGRASFSVEATPNSLKLGNWQIRVTAIKDPAELPWNDLGIDVVFECTGRFTQREASANHLRAGGRCVVIGAPSKDADFEVIKSVNQDAFDPDMHQIISNASCTTNSLVPHMKVLLDDFGVEMAMVTTVHAYAATQDVFDHPDKKEIRGRAAAINLVPTSTGSDTATIQVLPELTGRLRALSPKPLSFHSSSPPARRCLSDDPLQRLAFVSFIVGSYLRMQEHSNCAYHPMLPVMRGDDSDALDLLVMVFNEPGMIFESRNILPTIESGSVNQQFDFPVLTNERIDLRSDLAEIVGFQFLWSRDSQRVGGDCFCLYHVKPPS